MIRSPLAALAVSLLLLGGLAGYVAHNLELRAGLSQLVSESDELELALISSRLVDSPLTRTMVLAVTGPDLAAATRVVARAATALREHPEVAAVRTGPDAAVAESLFELYFPRRLLFLSDHRADHRDSEIAERLSDRGLEASASRLIAKLRSAQGQLIKEIAGADPLLIFPDLLARFDAARGDLAVVDGQFVDPSDETAILFLTTRHSAFDAARQAPLEDFIAKTFQEAAAQLQVETTLERSGVHRFAIASEQAARTDMNRITLVSVIGVTLLFLAIFRSLRLLVACLVPLAVGLLTATAAGILIFGPLHVMTLVFGSTLIGVCIDYPLHYLTHHSLLGTAGGALESRRRVFGAITMGALTTVAGFVGFAWSAFPGVRQIGIFAAIGVLAALAATHQILPHLLAGAPRSGAQLAALAEKLDGWMARLAHSRRAPAALVLAAVLVAVAGFSRLRLESDVFALSSPPEPAWSAEDERVRARVSQMDPGRFVVAIGEQDESALQRNDAVFERLEESRAASELAAFQSLHSFLPSRSRQQHAWEALRRQPRLTERLLEALDSAGFRPDAFSAFVDAANGAAPEPLRFEDLEASPLSELVSGFRIDLGDRVAILTRLRGVTQPTQLAARLADLEGVHYLDQQIFLQRIYGHYRTRTVGLIGVGLLAVVALLYLRYRRLRVALATAGPAVLAAAATLGALSLAGVAINLLHLLGLLLVLSIGVDYAIFLVASSASARAAALVGLVVACLSTCLAFGLLGLSSFPALQALGVTTLIGVFLSLLLAPSFLALALPTPAAPAASPEAA